MRVIVWLAILTVLSMGLVCEAQSVPIMIKVCGPCGCPNEGGPASSIYYGTWTNASSGNVLKMFPGNKLNFYIGDYRTPKGELTYSFCMNDNSRGPGLAGTAITPSGLKVPFFLNINASKPNEMNFELFQGEPKTTGYFYRN